MSLLQFEFDEEDDFVPQFESDLDEEEATDSGGTAPTQTQRSRQKKSRSSATFYRRPGVRKARQHKKQQNHWTAEQTASFVQIVREQFGGDPKGQFPRLAQVVSKALKIKMSKNGAISKQSHIVRAGLLDGDGVQEEDGDEIITIEVVEEEGGVADAEQHEPEEEVPEATQIPTEDQKFDEIIKKLDILMEKTDTLQAHLAAPAAVPASQHSRSSLAAAASSSSAGTSRKYACFVSFNGTKKTVHIPRDVSFDDFKTTAVVKLGIDEDELGETLRAGASYRRECECTEYSADQWETVLGNMQTTWTRHGTPSVYLY